jgi:hypothetical protein
MTGYGMKSHLCAVLLGAFSLALVGCGGGGEDAPPKAPSQADAKAALEKSGAKDSGSTSPGVLKRPGKKKSASENTPAKPD